VSFSFESEDLSLSFEPFEVEKADESFSLRELMMEDDCVGSEGDAAESDNVLRTGISLSTAAKA
jgi:hypothetical protein